MEHHFNTDYATKYGIEESIVINNLQFWINKNKANNKHFYDGRTWTYNSYKAFSELFPYWNEHKIKRILDSLIDQDVLVKGNYNKSGYDRTCWYAFKDQQSFLHNCKIHIAELQNGSNESSTPIPYSNTNRNTNENNKESFVNRVDEYKDRLGNQYQSFIDYWTEANDKGKMRFQDQKFFDVARRIGTWVKNAKNFQPTTTETPKIKLR
jgi:hypothetical protein